MLDFFTHLKQQAIDNRPDDILKRMGYWLEADSTDLHYDGLAMHNECASLWTAFYSEFDADHQELTFGPDDFKQTSFPQVSLTAQILRETVAAFNATGNLDLTIGDNKVGYAIRIVASVMRDHIEGINKILPNGSLIWASDVPIASTITGSLREVVHYPGSFFTENGPGTSHIYTMAGLPKTSSQALCGCGPRRHGTGKTLVTSCCWLSSRKSALKQRFKS